MTPATTDEALRARFEAWISAPPYERNPHRWSMDESKHAWPGQYGDISVQIAWEAWCEASRASTEEALRHAVAVCQSKLTALKAPAYNAACEEISICLEAAIERVRAGEQMAATATVQNEP